MKKKKVLWKLGPNERKEYLNLAGSFLNIVQVKKKQTLISWNVFLNSLFFIQMFYLSLLSQFDGEVQLNRRVSSDD